MTKAADKALVRASSAALTATGPNGLATRGLRDVEAAEQAEAQRSLLGEPENPKQGKIFVVDDQEEIREIVCSMLNFAGYECRGFAGGLGALEALESEEECELLLTDLLNTPMDGLSLLQQVKKQFPSIVVVMATAIHDESVARRCILEGAYEYLTEPFERRQLLDVVRRALQYRRLNLEKLTVAKTVDAMESPAGRPWKRVSEMNEEEKRRELTTSSWTDLPNLRAFDETEADEGPAPVVAVSMVDWLDLRGHDRETVVRAKADALREVRLNAYHDETRFDRFLYRGQSPEEMRSNLEKARDILRGQKVEVSDHHGGRCIIVGVDFTFGIGKNLSEAQAMERVNRGKAKRIE